MRRVSRIGACGALAFALTAFAPVAQAQERDPAAAQALFDQARELLKQKRFVEACPKLQESNRLDPGIGTQFHLADCYEQSGRVASAWAQFLDVASQARAAGQADRETAARKRAEKLEARLPRLVVNVPEGSKTPGLEIRRNGVLMGSAQWGTPVPVDPGEVELTASAPGKQTLKQSLRLEEGKTASYSLPVLAAGGATNVADTAPTETGSAPPVEAAPKPAPAAPVAPEPVAPAPAPEGRSTGNVVLMVTLASAGVVGLGVGTAFAVMAKGKYNDSVQQECDRDDPNACSPLGISMRNDARDRGNIATIGFAAGGALLVGAGVVWLVGGSSSKSTGLARHRLYASPVMAPGHAGLFVEGSF